MTDGREVAVGVIGLGFGAVHARVLGEMEGVRLAAVCDRDPGRLERVSRGRMLAAYADYSQMLRREQLDAVVVAVPTRLHEEVARAAMDAGVRAMLVEKPLAPSLAEGRRLVEAAERAGAAVMAGHVERFNPAIIELRRRVQGGDAGAVVQMCARRLGPFAARTRDISVIHDLALHDVDVMRYVLGLEVERVFAETSAGLRTAFEDSLLGLLRFEGDGPSGMVEANWLTPMKVRQVWLLGERGLLVADYADALAPALEFHESDTAEQSTVSGRVWMSLANLRGRETGPVLRIPLARREPLEHELTAFIEAVKGGGPMPVSRQDALAALAIADALAESGRSGLPVRPEQVV